MKPQVYVEEVELQQLKVVKKTPGELYLEERINAPYKKRNAYTNSKSCAQIGTIIWFVLQIVLHSIYVAPFIYTINNQLLSFFFILNYIILAAVIGHYFYLTTTDPVDSLIVDLLQKETVEKNSKQETVFCIMCQKTVKKTSKHCYYCGRCTEQFDHHCSCLNNCIGLGNYQQFIRLLFFYQIFNTLTTIQSIWVITKLIDKPIGGNVFLVILSTVGFGLILLVMIFHCYLNCWVKKPTYQFFKDHKERKYEVSDKVETRNLYGEVLAMALKDPKFILDKVKEKQRVESQENMNIPP